VRLDHTVHAPIGIASGELRGYFLSHRCYVDIASFQRPARNLGEMEHVVDELGHLLCARAHSFEEMDASLIERLGLVLREEHFAEAIDRS
jgi:hypothetical protein